MADTNSNRTVLIIATAVVVAGALALIVFVVIALSTGGDTASDADQTPFVTDEDALTIAIEDFLYSPEDLTINAGTTIIWTNFDNAVHDATERERSWSTPLLSKLESDLITFDQAGTFEYFCSIHPWMEGAITVR